MAEIRIGRVGIGATPGQTAADDSGVIEAQGDLQAFRKFKQSIDRVIAGQKQRSEQREQDEGMVEGLAAISDLRGVMEVASDGLEDMSIEELDELSISGAQGLVDRFQGMGKAIKNPHAKRIFDRGLAQVGGAFLAGFLDDVNDRSVALKRGELANVLPNGGISFGDRWAATLDDASHGDMKVDKETFASVVKAHPYFSNDEKTRIIGRFDRQYNTQALNRMAKDIPDTFVDLIRGGAGTEGAVDGSDLVRFRGMANDIQRQNFARRVNLIAQQSRIADSENVTPHGLLQRRKSLIEIRDSLIQDFKGDPAIASEDFTQALQSVDADLEALGAETEAFAIGEQAIAGRLEDFGAVGVHPADPRVARGVDTYINSVVMPVLRSEEFSMEQKTDLIVRSVLANQGPHPAIEGWISSSYLSSDSRKQADALAVHEQLQQETSRVYNRNMRGTTYGEMARGRASGTIGARAASSAISDDLSAEMDEVNAMRKEGVPIETAVVQAGKKEADPKEPDALTKRANDAYDERGFESSILGGYTDGTMMQFLASNDEGKPLDQRGPEFIRRDPSLDEVPDRMKADLKRLFAEEYRRSDGRNLHLVARRAGNRLMRAWAVDHLDPEAPTFSQSPILVEHGSAGVDYWQKQIEANAFKEGPDGLFVKQQYKMGVDRFRAFMQTNPEAPGGKMWVVYEINSRGEQSQVFFGDPRTGEAQPRFAFFPEGLQQRRREAQDLNDIRALEKKVWGGRAYLPEQLETKEGRDSVIRELRRDPRRFKDESFASLISIASTATIDGGDKNHAKYIAAATQVRNRLNSQINKIERIQANISAYREQGRDDLAGFYEKSLNEATQGVNFPAVRDRLNLAIEAYDQAEGFESEKQQMKRGRILRNALGPLRKIALDDQQEFLSEVLRRGKAKP